MNCGEIGTSNRYTKCFIILTKHVRLVEILEMVPLKDRVGVASCVSRMEYVEYTRVGFEYL